MGTLALWCVELSGTLIVVRLKNTGCSTGPLFPRREGSGSVGNSGAERRARGSDPNRCPALSGSCCRLPRLPWSPRQGRAQGLAGGGGRKGRAFPFPTMRLVDKGGVRIEDRRRRAEELQGGRDPIHFCLPLY